MKIKNGPREKFKRYGISSLTDEELLAILIKTGSKNKNVLELSKSILDEVSSLSNLNDYTIDELTYFNGIGEVKAMTIICSIELGNRIRKNQIYMKSIKCPKDAYDYLKNDFVGNNNEKVIVVYLNSNLKIVSKYILSEGGFNHVNLDIKEILKRGLKINAQYLIISHNHPSGSLIPSKNDEEIIKILENKLKEFQIILFDSLIITDSGYYSMKYNILK